MKLSEADLQAELEKFSTYFNNEYDSEKVKAAGEDVKTKIVDTYINSSENEELKGSKDEFTKAALENMDVAEAEKQIENGTSTADAELEKLKKPEDERGASMEENSFINANKKLYEDIYSFEDALNDCDHVIDDMDDYTCDYDYDEESFGEGQATVSFEYKKEADGSINVDIDLSNVISEIDHLVDDEFEKELDNYEANGGAYGDFGIVNTIADKFGLDGETVFNECNKSVPDSILKLAEQVKAIRVREYVKNMEK